MNSSIATTMASSGVHAADVVVMPYDGDITKLDKYIRGILRKWPIMGTTSIKTDGQKAVKISFGWTPAFWQLMNKQYAPFRDYVSDLDGRWTCWDDMCTGDPQHQTEEYLVNTLATRAGEPTIMSNELRAKYFSKQGFIENIREATMRGNDALKLAYATNRVELFPETTDGGINAYTGTGGVQRFLEDLTDVMESSDTIVKSVNLPNNQMKGSLYLKGEHDETETEDADAGFG